jgi:hypothetical protein
MKDIFSGFTEEELQKIITHTDLTMNEVIREKLETKKLKN